MKGFSKKEMQHLRAAKKLLNQPKSKDPKKAKAQTDAFVEESLKALGLK